MSDPLPPDPYQALGVAKDATAAAIKTQYRKLVLKCHPDKVKEESQKQEASDKFHKIQAAWEILNDEARRARYDAQIKLHDLRKDVFGHGGEGRRSSGGVDVRTAAYKVPTESARGGDFYTRGPDRYGPRPGPQYEERRPSYSSEEYSYEETSRPTSRKYDEYDRSSKRAPPREERERPRGKDSRENERASRKEKSRRTDKDVKRDRERKQAFVVDEPEFDFDDTTRSRRTPSDDPILQNARDGFFDFGYAETSGNGHYDERSRKTFQNIELARAHMERSRVVNRARAESEPREPREPREPSPTEQRRPSPVRMASSKDRIERTKGADVKGGFFGGVRHVSAERPKLTSRATEKPSSKPQREQKSSDEDRRSSRRKEESRDSKRPPTLNQTKSMPPEPRPSYQRQRSHSLQEEQRQEEPIPSIRRSETMPQSPSQPPSRDSRRRDNSRLHPENAYLSPEPTLEPEPVKFRYGCDQTYADDGDFIPTPDGFVKANAEGFQTQVHEPVRDPQRKSTRDTGRSTRYTRSPSPLKDADRDRQARRSSGGGRYVPQKPSLPRTTSKQYVVEPEGNYVRPAVNRENSSREASRTLNRENSGRGGLFGEISRNDARSGSPRQTYTYPPPPADDVQYARRYKESDFKVQSGYARRESEKPSYTRSGSSGLQRQAVY